MAWLVISGGQPMSFTHVSYAPRHWHVWMGLDAFFIRHFVMPDVQFENAGGAQQEGDQGGRDSQQATQYPILVDEHRTRPRLGQCDRRCQS